MMVICLSVKVSTKYTVLITFVSNHGSSHKWEPPFIRPLFNIQFGTRSSIWVSMSQYKCIYISAGRKHLVIHQVWGKYERHVYDLHPSFTINSYVVQRVLLIKKAVPLMGQLETITIINSLRPRQKGRHFADDHENICIPIKISLKFVPKGSINNIPALAQIMAWRRAGDIWTNARGYLNQCWLDHWRIYASLGLNELTVKEKREITAHA